MQLVPVPLSARGRRAVLRGLLQRHPVAALPRRDRPPRVPPAVVGPYEQVNRRFAEAAAAGRRAGRHRLGAGLPAAAGARGCCGSCARTCASASSTTSRSRRSRSSPQLPWRRRSWRACSVRTWWASSARRTPATSCAACAAASATPSRPGTCTVQDAGGAPHGRRPAPTPSPSTPASSPSSPQDPEVRGPGRGDPRGPGQPGDRPARRRPARLHQGHPPPHQGVRRAARRRAADARRGRAWSRSPAPAGSGWKVPRSCATRSSGAVGASTATCGTMGHTADRATCTTPTRARRWWRSTWPPTSCWSPRCATA